MIKHVSEARTSAMELDHTTVRNVVIALLLLKKKPVTEAPAREPDVPPDYGPERYYGPDMAPETEPEMAPIMHDKPPSVPVRPTAAEHTHATSPTSPTTVRFTEGTKPGRDDIITSPEMQRAVINTSVFLNSMSDRPTDECSTILKF